MSKKIFFIALLSALAAFNIIFAATKIKTPWPYANETKQQHDQRMQWWRDARFGMFIHWGVYAVPAGSYKGKEIGAEWIMNNAKIPVTEYKQYAKGFNPVKYDPDAWVKLAKQAGMKYIVITSKHHDGFALFDSKASDWDVVDATPYGKDLLKPLADACKKQNLKLGFYYSQAQDWCNPGGAAVGGQWDDLQKGDMDEYLRKVAVPQVKELLTNYGPVAVLWWDTSLNMKTPRAKMLSPLLSLQPGIITNDRLGGGYKGDFRTPEQKIPATGLPYDWETCMTINNSWGYVKNDNNWKSAQTLVRNLIDVASKGGNYLLNVGPTPDGQIPAAAIEKLNQIGKWMDVNGDSIYGTTASPFRKLLWGRCTKKIQDDGAVLYLHVFDWPADGKLLVPGLTNEIQKAYLLENKKSLKTTADGKNVTINVPAKAADPIDTVIVLQVKGDLKVENTLPGFDADGLLVLTANLADIDNPGYGQHAELQKVNGTEYVGNWTDARAIVSWEFTASKAGTFEISASVAGSKPSALDVSIGKKSMSNLIAASKKSTILDSIIDKITIRSAVPSTGGENKFQVAKLGSIKIEKAGDYTLLLKPAENFTPINLRFIEIKLK